jgi:hypothetical protein
MKLILIWGLVALATGLTYIMSSFFHIDHNVIAIWALTIYSVYRYISLLKTDNQEFKTKSLYMMIFLFVMSIIMTVLMTFFKDVPLF